MARPLAVCAVLALVMAAVAADRAPHRTLVLVDDLGIQQTHSTFFRILRGLRRAMAGAMCPGQSRI